MREAVRTMEATARASAFIALPTLKEFKKRSIRLFDPAFGEWESTVAISKTGWP